MAFAGLSLIADGELCALTASPINTRADRGYHLLVVEGYSRSKGTPPNGKHIISRPFLVGGHLWRIAYCPNGLMEDDEEFISVILFLDDKDVEAPGVNARAVFSFIDQTELQMSTRVSKSELSHHRFHIEAKLIRRDILERSRHLKDDSFVIRCDIIVVKAPMDVGSDKGAGSTASFVEMPPLDMQSHIGDLLLSKEGADITFQVGGRTFAAHRCVLAARSTVFKKQLFGCSTMTKTNVVEINDIEPEIFKGLLVFIYTDSFPKYSYWIEDDEEDESEEEKEEEETESGEGEEEEEEEEEGEEEEEEETESGEYEEGYEYVMWLLQLLEAADRYDLQRLKSICAEQLVERIWKYTVADITVVAERRQCLWLKDMCVEFIKSHSSVYTVLTAESLDQIIRTCSPSVLKELIFKFAP